jgi:hypothetical protein
MALSLQVSKYISSLWKGIQDSVVRRACQDLAERLEALARDLNSVSTVPQGAIVLWTGSSCPSGYSEVTGANGNFLKATTEAAGGAGTTGGSSSHSHNLSSNAGTSVPLSSTTINNGTGVSVSLANAGHTHNLTGRTETTTIDPPWFKVILCQKS